MDDHAPKDECFTHEGSNDHLGRKLVSSASAGLRGKWAAVGNMSAVVFVMCMFYLVYSNSVDTTNKHNEAIRVEMMENRKSHSSDARELATEIRGMRDEFRALSTTNQSLVTELRASRMQVDRIIKMGGIGTKGPPEPIDDR